MEMGDYNFHVRDAVKHGVDEAIFVWRMEFLIRGNVGKEDVLKQGRFWTWSTRASIRKFLPFWTDKELRRITASLIKQQVIEISDKFNAKADDRTLWYTFAPDEYQARICGQEDLDNQSKRRERSPKRAQERCGRSPKRAQATAQTGTGDCPNGQLYKEEIENRNKEINRENNEHSVNPWDIEVKRIFDAWNKNNLSPFKESEFLFFSTCQKVEELSRQGIWPNQIIKAIDNYAKVVTLKNTWWTYKATIDGFLGILKGKGIYTKFIDEVFDLGSFEAQERGESKGEDEAKKEASELFDSVASIGRGGRLGGLSERWLDILRDLPGRENLIFDCTFRPAAIVQIRDAIIKRNGI